jgi:hypothetical protein
VVGDVQSPKEATVNVPDGEQGRSWTVKCTEDTVLNAQSLEQVPYISWKLVDAPRIGKHGERITVYEHPTDGEGRCPTCHGAGEFPVPIAPRDGFGNQHVEYELCSDPFHSARARSDVDAVLRGLTFRRERSRPVFRNKHTGTEVVVLDLAVDDRGGFQGGCRQFTVVTDEAGPPGYKTRGPYSLDSFVQHWEPTGEHVPVDSDRIRERLHGD